jgi:lipid-binding SYLF domain-containing protein
MCRYPRCRGSSVLLAMLVVAVLVGPRPAFAASAAEIDRGVDAALASLFESEPGAKALAARAKGLLVFPSVLKGGFMFGGQLGEGALRKGGKTEGYYSTVAASYGFQAGVQVFGYALFFMTDSALDYLQKSAGFEIGAGPSVVVLDAGKAEGITSTTVQSDVYAFFFDQKGLMGGIGIQGSKITRIDR